MDDEGTRSQGRRTPANFARGEASALRLSWGVRAVKQIIRFAPKYVYALLATVYLFTLGVLRKRHRYLVWTICHHFRGERGRPAIPQIDLAEIAPEDIAIHVLAIDGVSGNINGSELVAINRIVRHLACRRFMEIGTFDGRTALNMAANSSAETQIFTLDLPADQAQHTALPVLTGDLSYICKSASGMRFKGSAREHQITQLLGDSATFDFMPFDGTMDLVFVDGSHAYDYVMCDSGTARKLLRLAGGMILWHDYGVWPDVTAALDYLYQNRPEYADLKWIKGTSLVVLREER
jgi:hypothetical protein